MIQTAQTAVKCNEVTKRLFVASIAHSGVLCNLVAYPQETGSQLGEELLKRHRPQFGAIPNSMLIISVSG